MTDTLPPGAQLLRDYIPPEREAALLAAIDAASWRTDLKRRVQHYGWRYDYRERRVPPEARLGPLPGWLMAEVERLSAEGLFAKTPDQVITNEYLPGQGITAHVDCLPCFGPVVASLTLGHGCAMAFRDRTTGETRAAWLAPRSLLLLTGPARTDWTHAIAARKTDVVEGERVPRGRRVSLTYREVVG